MFAEEAAEAFDEFRVHFIEAGVGPIFDQELESVLIGLRSADCKPVAGLTLAVGAIIEVILDCGADPLSLALTIERNIVLLDLTAGGNVGQLEALLFKLIESLPRIASDRAQVLAGSYVPADVIVAQREFREVFRGLAVGPFLVDFRA